MWSKSRKFTLFLCLSAVLLLAVLGIFMTFGLLIPFHEAKSTMDPDGILIVQTNDEGTLQIQWPEGENAAGYKLQVLDQDGSELHSVYTENCTASLPQLPADRDLVLRVVSTHNYGEKIREGEKALEATILQPVPQIRNIDWAADTEYDTVDVQLDVSGVDLCRIFLSVDGGEPVLVEEVRDGEFQLCFGMDDLFPVPEHGQQLRVVCYPEYTRDKLHYQGAAAEFTLTREDFLGRELAVEQHDNGDNSYTLTWNETKGEYYSVQLSEDGGKTWETKASIPADRERSFTLSDLEAFTDYTISVTAVGGQTMPDSEFAAVSDAVEIRTAEKLLYSTIWPQIDQPVYSVPEADWERKLGTVPAGSAWCVLGREGRYLKIRFEGQDAYIDSEYCMINLPEYIGNLCIYDITNSYSSIYLVHEYGIEDVSGTVIVGYEDVMVDEDEYLVPLLYPAAQKLIQAGHAAKAQGYTLKIYDSFRPQNATDSIYIKTRSILGNEIPDHTYSGKPAMDISWDQRKGGWVTSGPITGAPTYRRLMTNSGTYALSSFLAEGVSRHNYGLAMDLTMVDSTGTEVPMQTSIHDLSWYSAVSINNDNANLLRKIMLEAGFKGISSEWWHYQDNDAYLRNSYIPLRTGVSWECWVADNHGWRYRLPDGSFYVNCAQTIDGQNYLFDENGYVNQGVG